MTTEREHGITNLDDHRAHNQEIIREIYRRRSVHLAERSVAQTVINALAGALSGASVSVVFAPLDVVRTRMMVQRKPIHADSSQFLGIFGTMRHMYHTEGLRSLYKGLGTTMIGYIPNWSLYFMTYEYAKGHFGEFKSLGGDNSIVTNVISSILAGGVTSVATSPIWVVKTRLQTQIGSTGYKSAIEAFRTIYRTEGFIAFYRGLVASLFGLVHVGIQFPLYEYLKEALGKRRNDSRRQYLDVILASAISKVVASVAAYPHEVLRSRMQDHMHGKSLQAQGYQVKPYSNLRHAVRTIWREEGMQGYYRGLGSNLLRTVPAAVITLLSFETIASKLGAVYDMYRHEKGVKEHERKCE